MTQVEHAGDFNLEDDPLWNYSPSTQPLDVLAWYQCDHLGTPQELTDQHGDIAWSAQYKAWGEAQETHSRFAQQVGLTNPIRFQGQYHDHETGLHYNRYRYYDPLIGRFIGKDPISYSGGLNLYEYAPNPVSWVDPLGLARDTAKKAADAALNKGKTTGAASELRTGGKVFVGVSGSRYPVHPKVRKALKAVPKDQREPWHGKCAEIECLSRSYDAGLDPAGGTSEAINIGTSGKGHGTPKKACRSCSSVLTTLGVHHD